MFHRAADSIRRRPALRRWLGVPLTAGIALGIAAAPAQAAFPGSDGTIAYIENIDNNLEIFTINPDGSDPTNISNHAALDYAPDRSPDGSTLAFISFRSGQYAIWTMGADGSNPAMVPNTEGVASPTVGGVSWSRDGTRLAFASAFQMYVVGVDGSDLTAVGPAGSPRGPEWSPVSDEIAFGWSLSASDNHDVFVMNADGSGVTEVARKYRPAWAPSGGRIAHVGLGVGNTLVTSLPDGSATDPLGVSGVSLDWPPGCAHPSGSCAVTTSWFVWQRSIAPGARRSAWLSRRASRAVCALRPRPRAPT